MITQMNFCFDFLLLYLHYRGIIQKKTLNTMCYRLLELGHWNIKTIKNIISANGGIAKLSALTSAGVPKEKIYKLCSDGYLQRVRQGYYQLADELILSDEQVIASTIPEAIISMESALFRYGYSDFMPRVWSVTVPRSASRRLNTSVPIKVYYVKDDIYDLGKTNITENGVTFAIYDRERTICDMFKHRGKEESHHTNVWHYKGFQMIINLPLKRHLIKPINNAAIAL